jgi:hypothetical protein
MCILSRPQPLLFHHIVAQVITRMERISVEVVVQLSSMTELRTSKALQSHASAPRADPSSSSSTITGWATCL